MRAFIPSRRPKGHTTSTHQLHADIPSNFAERLVGGLTNSLLISLKIWGTGVSVCPLSSLPLIALAPTPPGDGISKSVGIVLSTSS